MTCDSRHPMGLRHRVLEGKTIQGDISLPRRDLAHLILLPLMRTTRALSDTGSHKKEDTLFYRKQHTLLRARHKEREKEKDTGTHKKQDTLPEPVFFSFSPSFCLALLRARKKNHESQYLSHTYTHTNTHTHKLDKL